ncbi:hypothetical protein [Rhodococcus coprophilus]|uniref:Uncharacterized protein n=1 Tax=Rhodococcus coprophilus TaxID=38310 RepID=A0A2X4TRM3_9NOCA|nr:hypothetical protein [Rhodococcus coprophilus]MBM7457607.1 hypothetical protein [Rhodococcus coprophilus]SQI30066.1 Uncharacterised protein [Rhodococcus coprophilus]
MRPMLGVAVDDGEVCAVLVDADVPSLGPFDSQRHVAGRAANPADTAAAAVVAMTERAANASLSILSIGLTVTTGGAAEAGEIADAIGAVTETPVEIVALDDARLAYLAGAPELASAPVLAVHTRTGNVESASIVDTGSRAVLASVTPAGNVFGGYSESLPEAMDEAIARAGQTPGALVFLDLEPGDAAPAKELATILGVPFITPHGVPWHRATGASLVAAQRNGPAAVAGVPAGRGRGAALLAVLVALVAILGGGLAVAVGGIVPTRDAAPDTSMPVSSSAPTPEPAPASASVAVPVPEIPVAVPQDPCGEARPVSWPVRGSDPDLPGPAAADRGTAPAAPVPAEPDPCAPGRPVTP